MPRRRIEIDASRLREADLETVNALACLQLLAIRDGFHIGLRRVPPELADLLCLCGLEQVLDVEVQRAAEPNAPSADPTSAEPPSGEPLPVDPPVGVEMPREPEQREEPCGVEEEGDAGDAVTRDVDHLE